ncbi:MAG: hypothetical protein SFX18_18010 [Pirellulales bacterium]|nr:hypothetical protein [Pirellulales bacterium]
MKPSPGLVAHGALADSFFLATRTAAWQTNHPLHQRRGWLAIVPWICLALGLVWPARDCHAQMGTVLSPTYYSAVAGLHEGSYQAALNAFNDELRGSIKFGTNRWIDAICYYTMIGESYYRLGNFERAVENYGAALALSMQYANWLQSINFPGQINSQNHVVFPWGTRSPETKMGKFPATILMSQGAPVTEATLQKGGVINPPKQVSVPVQEIVRCTILAIKRRAELLGPVAKHDTLLTQMLDSLQKNPGPPNSWSQAWHDVQVGTALAATGDKGQAIAFLKRGIALNGELDHPLTCYALVGLGHIYLEDNKFDEANVLFAQATCAAAEFGDLTILEEAFRYSYLVHTLRNQKGVFKELEPASAWAKKGGYKELWASLTILAAESAALNDQTKLASALLTDARAKIGRSQLLIGEVGVRLNYITALTEYQAGKLATGDAAWMKCQELGKNHSKWLYHLLVTAARLANNNLSERNALLIFEQLAGDPSSADWAKRPLDSLLTLSNSHQPLFEQWFELTLPKSPERAFEIADLAKRHRLFNSLPFGGRALSIRWILEGPAESLDQTAQLQRQDLVVKYPQYAELAQQSAKLKAAIAQLPLATTKPEDARKQADLMNEWLQVCNAQELLIRQMTLRREATNLVFPPKIAFNDLQQRLPQGQVALLTYATSRHIYAMLISKNKYAQWRVADPALLEKKTVAFLRSLGNIDPNRDLGVAQLKEDAWKLAGKECIDTFLAGSKVNFGHSFAELVIIPDGLLWYLPWEAVQVGDPQAPVSFLSKTRIRYAPTMGLALGRTTPRPAQLETGIVAGKFHPRGEASHTLDAQAKLADKLPKSQPLKAGLNVPSPLFGGFIEQLIVLDDLAVMGKGAWDWAPLNLDKGVGIGAVANWLILPWKRIDIVILPGFHTVAEDAVRNTKLGNGQDMFLTACGMMSHGARTVLISRWRTGGGVAYELIRNFVAELPQMSAPQAWQRSVELIKSWPIEPTLEPRLKTPPKAEELIASHPFWWAGYILIDTGLPGLDDPPPEVPPAADPAADPPKQLPPLPPADPAADAPKELPPLPPADPAQAEQPTPPKDSKE